MPRTARSRSAVGATIAALLPPSSRISRPNRPATIGATARPIRVEPVADTMATSGWAASAAPTSAPPCSTWLRPSRSTDVGGGPLEQGIARQRRQRRLVRRLPQHRVAGDEGERGVPRPHRDREVERRDHGARAHRVPRLHQPVARPLAGDRQAVQLARQADGEVADVDHLLDLAEALGADLAGLDRHQLAELGLVLAQQLAEAADEGAAHRRRRRPPRRRTPRRPSPTAASTSAGRAGRAERAAGDRRAGGEVAGALGRRRGASRIVVDAVGDVGVVGQRRVIDDASRRHASDADGVGDDRHRRVGLLDR